MDECVFCHRILHGNICSTCSIIYDYEFKPGFVCKNCGHINSLHPTLEHDHLMQCSFCSYYYFFTKDYQNTTYENEILQAIEKVCPECQGRVIYDMNIGELVCTSCGLVLEPTTKIY